MRTPDDDVARISVTGDQRRGQLYVPAALALLRKTQERRRLGHLAQLSAQERFDDGAYAYVSLAGGINAVHIVVGDGEETLLEEIATPVGIPDFLSGAVQNGFIQDVPADPPIAAYKTLATFHPTVGCAKGYGLSANYQNVRRLAVEPYSVLAGDMANPQENGTRVYSQYTRLKPTMYSGTMRSLVQALMGFARSTLRKGRSFSIYDEPPKHKDQPRLQPLTAYDKQLLKTGLQIRYDWHFTRTHGITYGADGQPWLVEIGITQGVVAMPLQVHPETTTAAFRRRLETAGDDDGLALLDQFGGFPTGEAFPAAEQLPAWIRAGRILRLVAHDDLQPFYAHTAYSQAMGWAFNRRGDEAHNTAWRYGDDDVQRGVHFMVPISIGAVRQLKPAGATDALARAFRTSSSTDIRDAAIWKLARLDADQLEHATGELARYGTVDALAYVDGLVLDPLAPASGHLSSVSEGTLWYPPRAKLETGTVARWPDASLGLLVAHSMKPASETAAEPKRCDTTVHVFFAGDELKWVKFFRDSGSIPGGSTDNFEACMYIGQWSQHADGGSVAVPPMFYTNDLDDRAELAGSTLDASIRGIDLGYCRISPNDDIVNPSRGSASRVKRFRLTTDIRTVTSPSIGTGIAVPFYDREAVYYAVQRSSQATTHTVSTAYQELTDPWYCTYKRNFPGYYGTYVGSGEPNDPWRPLHLQDVNGYGPNEYRTADPSSPLYDSSGPCRDIADSGPWAFGGDNIDAKLYSIPPPPLPAPVNEQTGPTGHYDVYLISSNGFGAVRTAAVDSLTFGEWGIPSPDSGDGESSNQYIESTANACGTSAVARYSTNLNGGLAIVGGPQWSGMETGFLTYIGVING